eukprot:jgi/Botrbrau1/3456/Bobra.139_1s0033.1
MPRSFTIPMTAERTVCLLVMHLVCSATHGASFGNTDRTQVGGRKLLTYWVSLASYLPASPPPPPPSSAIAAKKVGGRKLLAVTLASYLPVSPSPPRPPPPPPPPTPATIASKVSFTPGPFVESTPISLVSSPPPSSPPPPPSFSSPPPPVVTVPAPAPAPAPNNFFDQVVDGAYNIASFGNAAIIGLGQTVISIVPVIGPTASNILGQVGVTLKGLIDFAYGAIKPLG